MPQQRLIYSNRTVKTFLITSNILFEQSEIAKIMNFVNFNLYYNNNRYNIEKCKELVFKNEINTYRGRKPNLPLL